MRRALAAVLGLVLGAGPAGAAGAPPAGAAAGSNLAGKVLRAYRGVAGVEVRGGGIVEGVPALVVLRYTLARGRIAVAVTSQTFPRDSPLPDGRVVRAGTATLIVDYRRREVLQRAQGGGCWQRPPLDPRRFPDPLPLLPADATYGRPHRQGSFIVLRQRTSEGDVVDFLIEPRSLHIVSQRGVAGSVELTSARWRTLRSSPRRPAALPRCP